jgi:hypothetical protein
MYYQMLFSSFLQLTFSQGKEGHLLVSEKYDIRWFAKVEEYFRRFYTPRNATSRVTLDSVEVVFNSAFEERFRAADNELTLRLRGLEELRGEGHTDMQQTYLNRLMTSKNLVSGCNSNPISAWHGASSKHLDSICWYGLQSLSTTDPGIILFLLFHLCY